MRILGVRKRAALPSQARVLAVAVVLGRARLARHRLGRARARALVARLLARRVRAAVRAHRHHVVVARRAAALAACAHWIVALGLLAARSVSGSVVVVIPAVLPSLFLGDADGVFEVLVRATHGRARAALLVDVIGFVTLEQSEIIAAGVALAGVWVPPARVRVALVAARRAALVPLAPGVTAGAAVHVVVALVLIW